MKKASEYRHHAEECRLLARTADSDEHRELLINMAATWESLASERERMLQKHPELDQSMTTAQPASALLPNANSARG